MSLKVYKKKRNFKITPEPAGKQARSKSKLSFVVQRHKATRLHYDFRLEADGVLKSWAVPKGPSLNPKDKRLAIMVEDHPFDYKNFKGIIPEGNYGAGIVEIWDEGELSDIDNSEKKTAEKKIKAGIRSGSLKFRLHGKKLKGEFALVKLKGDADDNSWLLIKHNDEFAVHEQYDSEEQVAKNSPINKWLRQKSKEIGKPIKRRIKKETEKRTGTVKKKNEVKRAAGLNTFIKPMLARETNEPFSDKEWIYELKWDGYRAIAAANLSEVDLFSRNGNNFNGAYPVVVEALKQLNIDAVLDGEIVALDSDGRSNFQKLQFYRTDKNHPLEFRVFDLLSLNGEEIIGLPLIERKELLKQLIGKGNEVVKYSDHIEEKGLEFFEAARKKDLEGIIAKKADSLYQPGKRVSDWLKIKNHKSMEAVIAGFTEPAGSRAHFGALVLGVWDGDVLKYAGHTGSGFNSKTLKTMSVLLKPIIRKKSPFNVPVKTNMPATWVKPALVCEIKYTELTKDGIIRHPIFLRLRPDKKSKEVNMEAQKTVRVSKQKKAPAKKQGKKGAGVKSTADNKENYMSFGKIKVKVTNLEKIFWPEDKITKGDVINYYQSISKFILPYLKNRPESLLRNPNGIRDKGFFQKDAGGQAPDWVKSVKIYSGSVNRDVDYIICNNAATLAYLNNLGCIELNPWHSTISKPDHPDYMIIDIDPSENNTFDQVIEAANVVNDVFMKAGVNSYCKTSGASGLHVYVPTQKKYSYDQLKDFAHLVCMLTAEQLPEFTSLERNLKKRGKGKIYMDHLQNRKGQTISSVYSLRPRSGATVSMPLKWKDVKPGLSPQDFNIHNALKHIEKDHALFTAVLGKGIDMKECLRKLDR